MSGVATAAQALVGVRFRLHGRDRATGLDCVGLVGAALAAVGWRGVVPSGYPLRGGDAGRIVATLDAVFARGSDDRPGTIALVAPGPGQFHLIVVTDTGFIHADATLRRVVERPGAPPWPVIGRWRWQGDH